MRVFIAIELSDDIKTALAKLQTELRQVSSDVSWSRLENLHLTLKFLGEVEVGQLTLIEQACVAASSDIEPFSLSVKGTGAFPNLKQPRAFWAGLSGELEALRHLQSRVEEELFTRGFAKEARSFKPHLTLGRVKTLKNIAAVTARLLMYDLPELSFEVNEIVVMQSQLHPNGSIYTPLARYELK